VSINPAADFALRIAKIEARIDELARVASRARPVRGDVAAVTTNTSGVATVTHGLGYKPEGIVASTNGTTAAWLITIDNANITSTSFRVTVRNDTGAVVASTAVSFNWIAFA